MMRSRFFSVAFITLFSIAVSLSLAKTASAGFLVNPTGGTNLASPNLFSQTSGGATGELDNGAVSRALGFTFPLFGTNISTVFVSINGSLTNTFNTSNLDVTWGSSPGGTNRIAPAWDDYKLVGPDRIVEQKTADYYSMTWEVSTFGAGAKMKQQALLIGSGVTIQGFPFIAGDIAFSYNGMGAPTDSSGATIGVRQTNTNFAVPCSPGTPCTAVGVDAGGRITSYADPVFSAAGSQFLLFRPNGTSYDVSLQSTVAAIPEPGTLAFLGLAMPILLRLRRKK
jgi:hypothetical protein